MGPPRLTLVPKDTERAETAAAAAEPIAQPPLAGQGAPADADLGEATVDTASCQPATDLVTPLADETDAAVSRLATQERRNKLRMIEAILFAAPGPLAEAEIAAGLIESDDLAGFLVELQNLYAERGVNLVKVADKWAFRTAEDLSFLLQRYSREERRLSKAALETMAIIAYHQPVTRAEIEEIRGVSTSAGTVDILLETGWIRPRGRRRAPGRPVTYGTTESFLDHFGLATIRDLPGLAELKGLGLLNATLPPGFIVPEPRDVAALMPDELPLEEDAVEDAQGALDLDDGEEPDDGGSLKDGPAHSSDGD